MDMTSSVGKLNKIIYICNNLKKILTNERFRFKI